MPELFVTTICTVISGVLVFILGQLYVEFVLRPIQEYKNIKAKIAKALIYNAHYYANPRRRTEDGEYIHKWENASNEMRELAAEISAFSEIMPSRLLVFFSIPKKENLLEASKGLIGVSNSFFADKDEIKHTLKYAKTIRENLKIKS